MLVNLGISKGHIFPFLFFYAKIKQVYLPIKTKATNGVAQCGALTGEDVVRLAPGVSMLGSENPDWRTFLRRFLHNLLQLRQDLSFTQRP